MVDQKIDAIDLDNRQIYTYIYIYMSNEGMEYYNKTEQNHK